MNFHFVSQLLLLFPHIKCLKAGAALRCKLGPWWGDDSVKSQPPLQTLQGPCTRHEQRQSWRSIIVLRILSPPRVEGSTLILLLAIFVFGLTVGESSCLEALKGAVEAQVALVQQSVERINGSDELVIEQTGAIQ